MSSASAGAKGGVHPTVVVRAVAFAAALIAAGCGPNEQMPPPLGDSTAVHPPPASEGFSDAGGVDGALGVAEGGLDDAQGGSGAGDDGAVGDDGVGGSTPDGAAGGGGDL